MTPEVARPRSVIGFEAVIAVVAAALLVVLVCTTLRTPDWTSALTPLSVAVALSAPVLARFGVSVEGRSQSISVTFETAALVLLMFVVPEPLVGLTLWSVFMPLGLITGRSRWRVHLFNASLTVICGASFAYSLRAFEHWDPLDPATLFSVAMGSSLAAVIDLGLSWLHVHLRTGQPVSGLFGADDILIGSGVASGTASIGYLGALLHQLHHPWVMLILLIPVGSVVVASRATRQSMDDQRRLAVLLDSSRDRRHLDSADDILASAVRHAGVLLGSPNTSLTDEPPVGDWIGAPIDVEKGRAKWLVAPPRRDRSTWLASERQALDTLAADTAESIERAHLIRQLSRMASLDGLSGLANRTTFTEAVSKSLARAEVTRVYPSLLYLDLDDFKQVNDLFGHHVGDALVREVGTRLRDCMPENGVAARLGGDEFAVLTRTAKDGHTVAERILRELGREFSIAGHELAVSASIGMADATPGISVDQLFRNADLAMYHAKAERLDTPARYDDGLRVRDRVRSKLRDDLVHAVERGQLRLVYQPVVDLATGLVDGVEALVRWEHPERGMLAAGEFVQIAEESGLISELGEWVLRQALHDAPRLSAAAGRPLSVAVNVSARQLGDDSLITLVRELLQADRTGTNLVLELTESALISENPTVRRRLQTLVELGATLALDDFGIGYSSVGYLRWLPMQVLKLDRSLLTSFTTDAKARKVVEALLAMGRTLGLVVVAEGIERPQEVELLAELGCPLGQGWYLSRPVSLADMEELVRAGRLIEQRAPRLKVVPGGQ